MEKIILEKSESSDKDISQCKGKTIGMTDLVSCLTTGEFCLHRLDYGYEKFCSHSKKKEIAFKTEQENQK